MKSVYCIILSIFLCITICCTQRTITNNAPDLNIEYQFHVESYDLYYELEKLSLRSNQKIIIVNSTENHTNQINFSLHPKLIIDKITIKNSNKEEIPVIRWDQIGLTEV